MRGIGSWQLPAVSTVVVFCCKVREEPLGNDARGNAVVTCFITLHTFGCQTKSLETKNE